MGRSEVLKRDEFIFHGGEGKISKKIDIRRKS
jgi:hypothetical protein